MKVECGMLSDIASIIKSISNVLVKALNKLYDYGMSVDNAKRTDENGVEFDVKTAMGNKFHVICNPSKTAGKYDLTFLDSHKVEMDKKNNVSESKIQDTIQSVVSDLWGEDTVDTTEISQAKKLQVGLKKVVSAEHTDVHLTSICCSMLTNPTCALELLTDALCDDTFIENISEDPKVFDITAENDSIDITPVTDIPCFDYGACFSQMIGTTQSTMQWMQWLHWTAVGNDFETKHRRAEEYYHNLLQELDYLGELCVQYTNTAPMPTQCLSDTLQVTLEPIPDDNMDVSYDRQWLYIKKLIADHADMLNLYYVNFPHSVQSTLDDWIEYWNKESNYIIEQIYR